MDRSRTRRLAAVLGWGPVAVLVRVVARYDAAGGALLAGGLAYSALFAVVPLAILVTGIAGLVVAGKADQAAAVDVVASVLPPVREVIRLVLEEASGAAGTISLLGGSALVWGASRFVVAFESAMSRVFGGSQRRGFLARNLGAVLAVLALIGTAILGAGLTGLASFLDAARQAGHPGAWVVNGAVLALLPFVGTWVSIALVYRFVPVLAPTWRAILPPAVVVALVLEALARTFVFLAPRLIGAAGTVGALATAFAALAWLGVSFQTILLGAAWVRERDVTWGAQRQTSETPPA